MGDCIIRDVEDEEIALLATSLPYIVEHGRANATVEKYKAGWSGWVQWSSTKREVTSRPAHPFFVAIYLNHLYFTRGNKGCITNAVYGIRWAHHIVGLESPTDNPLVRLTQEGCVRLCGGKKVRKEAMPVETIRGFVDEFNQDQSSLSELRFLVVCLTAFAGFFRIQEVLDIQLRDVHILPDHIKIFLPFSKMDQHRNGDNVYIAKTGTKYCPVAHIINFLEKAELDIARDKDAFLVPTLHKTKKGHRASKTKGISYTRISEIFHDKITNKEMEGKNYSLQFPVRWRISRSEQWGTRSTDLKTRALGLGIGEKRIYTG